MITKSLVPAALAFIVVAYGAHAESADCSQFLAGGQPPRLVNARLAERTTSVCHDAYAALASGVTHGAIWSAEHPTRNSLHAARRIRREGEFHVEDQIPIADQGQLADYRRSGFDRGHMTPSGDMPDERAQQQTFSLGNMVPQTAELNRGIWEGVESAVRDLAARDGDIYVVTGPAFIGQEIRSIGPDGVLVPTATWKAVYDPTSGQAGAYICQNTTSPSCDIVSVAALARIVDVDPFPALSDDVKEAVMALPEPKDSPYASEEHREHRPRRDPGSLLQQLFDQ